MKRQVSVAVIALVLMLCVSITGAEENNSDKYSFERYGGEEFTPQAMEFGENLKNQEKNELLSISTNERKHVLLQFYANPIENQRKLRSKSFSFNVHCQRPEDSVTNLDPHKNIQV
ncbi:hypothetical protein [Methanolobus halotolerans]|uniref:Uncharacterized protein n=1 Tax=Methanolobus halotolerans TaxID=2052935 RepID=A0A4E0Q2I6_9EURY|nr:hypothetical protein [Methanolobus halotolerans]TGC06968.1 hypothetical protein CUN85_12215 [Methanolobus halotolerans]